MKSSQTASKKNIKLSDKQKEILEKLYKQGKLDSIMDKFVFLSKIKPTNSGKQSFTDWAISEETTEYKFLTKIGVSLTKRTEVLQEVNWDKFNPSQLKKEQIEQYIKDISGSHHLNQIKTKLYEYYSGEMKNDMKKIDEYKISLDGIKYFYQTRKKEEEQKKQQLINGIMQKYRNVDGLFADETYKNESYSENMIKTLLKLHNEGKEYPSQYRAEAFSKGCWNSMDEKQDKSNYYLNQTFLDSLSLSQLDKIDKQFNKGGKFEIEEYNTKDGKKRKRLKKFNFLTIEQSKQEKEKKMAEIKKIEAKKKEEEQKKQQQKQLEDLQQQIVQLTQQNIALTNSNNDLNTQLKNSKKQLADEQDKNKKSKKKINDATSQNQDMSNQISDLKKQIKKLTDDNSNLSGQNNKLQGDITSRQSIIDAKDKLIKDKEKENENLKNEINNAKSTISEKEEENNILKANNDSLNQDLNAKNQTIVDQNKSINDKNQENENLKNEINILKLKANKKNMIDEGGDDSLNFSNIEPIDKNNSNDQEDDLEIINAFSDLLKHTKHDKKSNNIFDKSKNNDIINGEHMDGGKKDLSNEELSSMIKALQKSVEEGKANNMDNKTATFSTVADSSDLNSSFFGVNTSKMKKYKEVDNEEPSLVDIDTELESNISVIRNNILNRIDNDFDKQHKDNIYALLADNLGIDKRNGDLESEVKEALTKQSPAVQKEILLNLRKKYDNLFLSHIDRSKKIDQQFNDKINSYKDKLANITDIQGNMADNADKVLEAVQKTSKEISNMESEFKKKHPILSSICDFFGLDYTDQIADLKRKKNMITQRVLNTLDTSMLQFDATSLNAMNAAAMDTNLSIDKLRNTKVGDKYTEESVENANEINSSINRFNNEQTALIDKKHELKKKIFSNQLDFENTLNKSGYLEQTKGLNNNRGVGVNNRIKITNISEQNGSSIAPVVSKSMSIDGASLGSGF